MTFNDYIQLFQLITRKSQKWGISIGMILGVEKYILMCLLVS